METTTTPADVLADWIEAQSSVAGQILAYRVATLLPRSADVLRSDSPEGVASLAAWVRACSDGILQSAGVTVMVAALIDFTLASPEPNMPPLPAGAPSQRSRFVNVQNQNLQSSWATLRTTKLSHEGIDAWVTRTMFSLLPRS